jgi:hypothetical protein
LELLWLDYTREEIAEKLEISPDVVSQRLYHWRREKLIPMVRVRRLIPPAGYALAKFSPDYVADADETDQQVDADDISLFAADLFGGPALGAAKW